MTRTFDDEVRALSRGTAYVDLGAWRKTLVRGADARAWLGDLVTADVEGLEAGSSRRSLLLSPTGRLRADFTIAALREGFLLVQDPVQPSPIADLLAPYVLSSDVSLEDRTEVLALFAFPGPAPRFDAGERYVPSVLGVGTDIVAAASERRAIREAAAGLAEAGRAAFDAWQVARGEARLGKDLAADSLPHEAGLDAAIAYHKGCFLGQEAVAKVRNLGHPPFVVLALRADADVRAGDAILSDGSEVGTVTSAATVAGGVAAIGRVRWAARDGELRTGSGIGLRSLGLASGTAPGAR